MTNNNHRIFFDTNVLVNYKTEQKDDVFCVDYLLKKKHKEFLFTSSSALGQTVSMLQSKRKKRKVFSPDEINEYIEFLTSKITVLECSENDVKNAFTFKDLNDIEDNIQYVISQKMKCKYIITNDISGYSQHSKIEAINPNNVRLIKKII